MRSDASSTGRDAALPPGARVARRRLLQLGAALLTIVAPTGAATTASSAAPAKAPDFRLPLRGGGEVQLSQLKGQVVMINFWASWCGPCRQEMPLLDAMHRKYKGMGFTLLGINVEPDSTLAEQFLAKTPVGFPIAYDRDSKISKQFKVQGMPSSVIVDRRGNLRVLHKGYRPGDENKYLDHIRTLIRE
ncbi:MAG: TlpA family protein disulfide reductase [Steroidobacteraceae bacterium]|nr:TlpA family protein disulfide reductase [Steroidobacteraceae bacterium]MDW8257842.1 TlpA disulfide reductase family protein [Gammaproteobacteria bacterium]